jgi:hypothetical protein
MYGALLVTDQDMLDLILLEQFVVEVENRSAGIAENVFRLFFLQAPDYNFRTSHHGHGYRSTKKLLEKRVTLRLDPGLVNTAATRNSHSRGNPVPKESHPG